MQIGLVVPFKRDQP